MLDLDHLIVSYKDFKGDWRAFNEAIYDHFCDDFISDCPIYKRKEVWLSDHRKDHGKEGTFWHVTTNDQNKSSLGVCVPNRIPDIKRSERIRWIRPIIEAHTDQSIKSWIEEIRGRIRHHLLYNDEFLVVLGEVGQNKGFVLVTSFYIDEHKRPKYLDRYNRYKT